MSDAQWRLSMDTLVAAARLIEALPLDQMSRTLALADSLGPVLYPTEYQTAMGGSYNLEGQKALVRAAIRLRDVYEASLEGRSIPRD